MTVDELERAIKEVRELLQLDGADLLIDSCSADTASLELKLDNVSCPDCVLKRPMIEAIVLDHVREHLPNVVSVTVIDPRESADQETSGADSARH